jgi:YbbR domain-containing protein
MSSPAYSFFRRNVLHNLGLKLLSLALAVGLWLAVAGEPISEVAVDVPIALHNMPPNIEISSASIPKAQIRLRGPERIIRRLQPADIYAELDLKGVKPGERTFDLTANQVHHSRELTVVQVVPSDVHLAFDVRSIRDIPVQPRVIGTFADGYQIGQIQVEPSTVKVAGPKKRVEAVDAATTDPVDVTGAINRMSFVRHPYVSDPLVQVSSTDPVRVTILMEKTSPPPQH